MKHQPHIPDRPEPTRRAATPRSPSELLVPTRPPRPPKRLKAEGEPRRMGRFWRFVDGLLSFAFLALVIGSALAIWMRQSFDAPGPLAAEAVMIVPKGDGALETAEKLEQAGIITDRRLFMLQYYVARRPARGPRSISSPTGACSCCNTTWPACRPAAASAPA